MHARTHPHMHVRLYVCVCWRRTALTTFRNTAVKLFRSAPHVHGPSLAVWHSAHDTKTRDSRCAHTIPLRASQHHVSSLALFWLYLHPHTLRTLLSLSSSALTFLSSSTPHTRSYLTPRCLRVRLASCASRVRLASSTPAPHLACSMTTGNASPLRQPHFRHARATERQPSI